LLSEKKVKSAFNKIRVGFLKSRDRFEGEVNGFDVVHFTSWHRIIQSWYGIIMLVSKSVNSLSELLLGRA